MIRSFVIICCLIIPFILVASPAKAEPSTDSTFNKNYSTFNNAIGSKLNGAISSPNGIINALLPGILILAGLILFVMIIWGGFEMLTAGTEEKNADAGKSRVTAGIIGFVIIFCAYWITQLLQIMLGVNILKQ